MSSASCSSSSLVGPFIILVITYPPLSQLIVLTSSPLFPALSPATHAPPQSVRRVKEANADMRCLSIKLPKIHEDKQSRDVWW
jgi:hypothetical protein